MDDAYPNNNATVGLICSDALGSVQAHSTSVGMRLYIVPCHGFNDKNTTSLTNTNVSVNWSTKDGILLNMNKNV